MNEMEKSPQYASQKLGTVYTGNLLSGMPYQRPVKDWKVNKLVREWDERLADPVTVSSRDGNFYLVDGQNRVAALRRMNGGKDLMVPCRIHYGLSYAEEAELCWKLDQAKSRLTLAQSITALKESSAPTGCWDRMPLTGCCVCWPGRGRVRPALSRAASSPAWPCLSRPMRQSWWTGPPSSVCPPLTRRKSSGVARQISAPTAPPCGTPASCGKSTTDSAVAGSWLTDSKSKGDGA